MVGVDKLQALEDWIRNYYSAANECRCPFDDAMRMRLTTDQQARFAVVDCGGQSVDCYWVIRCY